ncbi:MAG: lamin tail domain-containing protein [bacterium]|nr:lamin tail domain-containing protein [bacterium]MDZ4248225.1 lamin tail domain-containing protein [Patescibacteria group bacterium]
MKYWLYILAGLAPALTLPLPAVAADPSPVPVASPAASPTPAIMPVPAPSGGELRINEFLPNPAGVDTGNEWIELKNVSPKALDIGGVKLKRQNGTTVATVPASTTLNAGQVFLMTASGSMVNDGDTLELWAGTVKVDQVTYDTAEDGLSWVRLSAAEGAWSGQPTPGQENPSEVSSGPGGEGSSGAGSGGGAVTDPTSASTRGGAAGSSTVSRRTAAALAKRGPLPQAGVGTWPYVLPMLLATLYAYKTREDL